MKQRCLDLVFLGLSLSSSWGNGHATTYRALLRGLAAAWASPAVPGAGCALVRGGARPAAARFLRLELYHGVADLPTRFGERIAAADAVVVGSYVPDGIAVVDCVNAIAGGVRSFYDIDTPITVEALEQDCCAYLAVRQLPDLDLYLSFTGGPLLAYLAESFGVRRPRALYCAVDPALYQPLDMRLAWDLGYLGTYAPIANRRWSGCCWSRRVVCRSAASWWLARNIRARSHGRRT